MKCRKCGKKVVISNGRILDRLICNTTDLCDDCLRQQKEEEKQEREDRAKQQDMVKEASGMADDNSGIVGEIYKRQRRPPLDFIKMGVPLNAVIMFDNNGISVEAKVLSEKKVIYNGVEYSLTKLTQELLEIEYNIHPTRYWYYNGKCLSEYYDEIYGA